MVTSQKLRKQYAMLAKEAGDALLLMQVGTFMQGLDRHADEVTKITGIKLKLADEVGDPIPTGLGVFQNRVWINTLENWYALVFPSPLPPRMKKNGGLLWNESLF